MIKILYTSKPNQFYIDSTVALSEFISSAAKLVYLLIANTEFNSLAAIASVAFSADMPEALNIAEVKVIDAIAELEYHQLIELEIDIDKNEEQIYKLKLLSLIPESFKLYPYPSSNKKKKKNVILKQNELARTDELVTTDYKIVPLPQDKTDIRRFEAIFHSADQQAPWLKRWTINPKTLERVAIIHDWLIDYHFEQNRQFFKDKAHVRQSLQQPGKFEVVNDIYSGYLENQNKKQINKEIIASESKTTIAEFKEREIQKQQQELKAVFDNFTALLKRDNITSMMMQTIRDWVEENDSLVSLTEEAGKYQLKWKN